jgi:hypothetical protein
MNDLLCVYARIAPRWITAGVIACGVRCVFSFAAGFLRVRREKRNGFNEGKIARSKPSRIEFQPMPEKCTNVSPAGILSSGRKTWQRSFANVLIS